MPTGIVNPEQAEVHHIPPASTASDLMLCSFLMVASFITYEKANHAEKCVFSTQLSGSSLDTTSAAAAAAATMDALPYLLQQIYARSDLKRILLFRVYAGLLFDVGFKRLACLLDGKALIMVLPFIQPYNTERDMCHFR